LQLQKVSIHFERADRIGDATVAKLRKMRTTDDLDDDSGATSETSGRPAWMSTLASQAKDWLELLQEDLTTPSKPASPLARFFAREMMTGQNLLRRVRDDLADLIAVCSGDAKQTNELRALLSELNKGKLAVNCKRSLELMVTGIIPVRWRVFKIPRGTSVSQYISNLARRLAQLEDIARQSDDTKGIWLGGLFQPEGYITATRQAVAQSKGWSLEMLEMRLELEETGGKEGFAIEGK
jgi:dynein heavy chain 1